MNYCKLLLIIILIHIHSNFVCASEYPDGYIFLEGAQDIEYIDSKGKEELSYYLTDPYPANKTINNLYAKFIEQEWLPINDDYQKAVSKSKWSEFIDSTRSPSQVVYQWNNQFTKNNDLIWCTLEYSYPENSTSQLEKVKIVFFSMPKDIYIKSIEMMKKKN